MENDRSSFKIPTILKSKFVLITLAYFFYMLFFDSNNIPSQIKLWMELQSLKKQEHFYSNQLKALKEENKILFSSTASIEKFARENYWMKRDSEDVYIFVKKD